MTRVLAMILAGGIGDRLSILAAERAKPAVPFAGKYRIIDFALSNCVNAGINKVAVLTQYNPRSLMQHLGIGKPWDLDRTNGGIDILQPYLGRSGTGWYHGTADAIYQNLYFVAESSADHVLILAGDHVYTMHYDAMINFHRQKNADITVGVVEVPMSEASRFGTVLPDRNDRIIGFDEKVKEPRSNLASMGIYVFNKQVLINCLEADAEKANSKHDFGGDIIPGNLDKYNIFAHKFSGYWRDVGTIEAYWKANMDLIVDLPEFNLYDPAIPVRTTSLDVPPAKIGPNAHVNRSLISAGCIVNGSVVNSILSSQVYVETGARVVDSIIFSEAMIEKDSIINRSIIDKQVWVGPGSFIGYGEDYSINFEEPDFLNTGITLVGKGAKIPPGTKIGRNCKINGWVDAGDFSGDFIPSGATIKSRKNRRYRV